MPGFFFSFLLILCLLYWSGCLLNAAQDNHDIGIDAEVVGSSSANTRTRKGLWASLTDPSYMMKRIKRAVFVNIFFIIFLPLVADACLPSSLRFSSIVRAFVAPQSSPSIFWEKATECEEILQSYVPRLLKRAGEYFKSTSFTDITHAMKGIVRATAAFRDSIQDALVARHITTDVLTEELEAIFMKIMHPETIPPPSNAPGHAERDEMVNKVMDDTETALVHLATRYEIKEEIVTAYLATLRPHVHALIVAVGDINEQYPQLFSALTFSVATLLVPESWILRPFLGVFGFGPAGPVKGSIAANIQRRFWGGAVKSGSWFAMLQAAGMGATPKWARVVTQVLFRVVGALIRVLWALIFYSRRER